MAVKLVSVLLTILMIMAPFCHSLPEQSPEAVEKWFKRFAHAKPKLTKLHFFIHDIVGGPNPTTIPVAHADITEMSPTRFGLVNVMDGPLTAGPELDSELIGYVQGTFSFASQEEIGLLLTLNFVFTHGKYNGSTLSVLGRKTKNSEFREYPIVGGSGVFRMAQGIATDHGYTGPVTTGTPPVECQVMVLHYEEFEDGYDM